MNHLKIKSQLNLGSVDDNKAVTLIVDASDLTVSNKGDYIEEKWIHKKKEFIKLNIAVDERSKKVVSYFPARRRPVLDRRRNCPLYIEKANNVMIHPNDTASITCNQTRDI